MTTQPVPAERPRGRDEVRHAVLDAAVRLFVQRGPASVSLRDIAAEANVNLGLLYRHFGTKAELLSAAVDQLVDRFGEVIADCLTAPDAAYEIATVLTSSGEPGASPMQPYARMLAWLLLDGVDAHQVQSTHPAMPRLLERLLAEGRDTQEAQITAAILAALVLGWSMFESHLAVAAHIEHVPTDEIRCTLADAFRRLVQRGA